MTVERDLTWLGLAICAVSAFVTVAALVALVLWAVG